MRQDESVTEAIVAILCTAPSELFGVAALCRVASTVVSGLARGIDTAALTNAIEKGGQVIAVIGTAIGESYPHENASLQDEIAPRFLLVSQVPIVRSSRQRPPQNRACFPGPKSCTRS